MHYGFVYRIYIFVITVRIQPLISCGLAGHDSEYKSTVYKDVKEKKKK